jgi:DNA-binding LacI/PurR family transcriptional regulator
MAVTSADVAKRAGVSRATVSLILNGRDERFASETRDRVHRAAAELDYHPSVAGRTLARGSSDLVVLLIPNTTFGRNLQDLVDRLTEALAAAGLTLVLRFSTPSAQSLDRIAVGMAPAAVVSMTPFTLEQRRLLDERGVHAIGPSHADDARNRAIGELQARHLIAQGHTRLAFAHLSDARQDPFGIAREDGVRTACSEAGLAEPQIVRLDVDPQDALAAVDELEPPGIAVVCYNDDVATALLSAGTVRGWRVPTELALIGMDATPLSRLTIPPLTTVAYDLGTAATEMIERVLTGLGRADAATSPAAGSPLAIVPGGTS